MKPDALAALREIHVPPPVGWWPPAPGWWLLAFLLLLGAVLLFRAWKRRRRARLPARQALALVEAARRRHRESGDDLRLAAELSRLLRRVAISCFPREEVAGLSGRAWLEFLDRVLEEEEKPFTRGPGRVLAEAPYGGQVRVDGEALLALAERWIRRAARGGCHA